MRYPQFPGHPALFSFVICFVGFPDSLTQKRATDMQRNHAGMNFEINYLWLKKTISKALNPVVCGGMENREFKALSIDRLSSEAFPKPQIGPVVKVTASKECSRWRCLNRRVFWLGFHMTEYETHQIIIYEKRRVWDNATIHPIWRNLWLYRNYVFPTAQSSGVRLEGTASHSNKNKKKAVDNVER